MPRSQRLTVSLFVPTASASWLCVHPLRRRVCLKRSFGRLPSTIIGAPLLCCPCYCFTNVPKFFSTPPALYERICRRLVLQDSERIPKGPSANNFHILEKSVIIKQ